LLRAEWGTRTVVSEPDLGWSRLVLGGVEIRDIAGDHFNFTQPPLAASTARVLRDCLDQSFTQG
ncbi:MAG TPA: hypothetical protein VM534_07505, partial [Thermoanaerobaculia bacterium]|nr:hypothetical protein [Thermoanaerobaculia bacterium]